MRSTRAAREEEVEARWSAVVAVCELRRSGGWQQSSRSTPGLALPRFKESWWSLERSL